MHDGGSVAPILSFEVAMHNLRAVGVAARANRRHPFGIADYNGFAGFQLEELSPCPKDPAPDPGTLRLEAEGRRMREDLYGKDGLWPLRCRSVP